MLSLFFFLCPVTKERKSAEKKEIFTKIKPCKPAQRNFKILQKFRTTRTIRLMVHTFLVVSVIIITVSDILKNA